MPESIRLDWDSELAALVHRKARTLLGRAGYTHQDLPDLEQSLAVELLMRLPAYDPTRADRPQFLRMIVYRAAAKLLRDRRAAKRSGRSRQTGATDLPAPPENDPALSLDLAEAIAALPLHLRELAIPLRVETITHAARSLGIARSTAQVRRHMIRQHWESRGLQKYISDSF